MILSTASRPSLCLMLVYRDFTSHVANMKSSCYCVSLSMFMTCVVSLRYDRPAVAYFCRKWSRYSDRFCVREPMPDIIGLPGGVSIHLCTFGRK
ncbi:hypothetical protein FKM82_017395 [Ascaphus truei]